MNDHSQTEASEVLNMSLQSYARLETDQRNPSYEEVEKVAVYGGLSLLQFKDWNIKEEPTLIYYVKIRDEKNNKIDELETEIKILHRLIEAIQKGGEGGRMIPPKKEDDQEIKKNHTPQGGTYY